jgi:hypothetical protein
MAGSARLPAFARERRDGETGTEAESDAGAEDMFLFRMKEVIAAIATSKYSGSYSEGWWAKKFPHGRIILMFSTWRAVPECQTVN